MKLSLITDDEAFALEAEAAGVERIMIDLERDGKAARQANRGLFLSHHRLEAIPRMKAVLTRTALVVRINPLTERSAAEIEAVVAGGADFIMLPYFSRRDEVRRFVDLVDGRSGVILLIETKPAAERVERYVFEPGVDEAHIGLNDLSISFGHDILFEPFQTGLVDRMAAVLRAAAIPFGVGGMASLSRRLPVDAERLLTEQVRLGATRAWLGRSFRGELETRRAPGALAAELRAIRLAVEKWRAAPPEASCASRHALLADIAAWKASLQEDERRRRPTAAPAPVAPRRARRIGVRSRDVLYAPPAPRRRA